MKLYRLSDAPTSDGDIVFRQSTWNQAIAVFLCLGFAAIPFVIVARGGPKFLYAMSALSTLIALVFFGSFRKTLGPGNWLLRVAPGGRVVIKFRSFRNTNLPA